MAYRKLYPEGKEKAVTFSYDDGVQEDKRLIRLFGEYGAKATFNLNSGLDSANSWIYRGVEVKRIPWEQMPDLYKGHEIACHSSTHPHLEQLDDISVCRELLEDRTALSNHFRCKITGMALPYGTWNETVLLSIEKLGFNYCRTTRTTHEFSLPNNFLLWDATCHHDDPELMNLAERFSTTQKELALFYVWGHAYEFDGNDNWGVIENLLKYLHPRSDIWYASNGEVQKYVSDISRLIAKENWFCNPSSQDVWVEANGKVIVVPAGQYVQE